MIGVVGFPWKSKQLFVWSRFGPRGWRDLPDVDGVGAAVYDSGEAVGDVGGVRCAGGGGVPDEPDGVVVVDFGWGGEDVG